MCWNVENIHTLFENYQNLQYVNISNLDTLKVTKADKAFKNFKKLKKIDWLNDWRVENIHDMCSMFKNCESLEYLDLSSWKTFSLDWSKQMFQNCKNLKIIKFYELDNTVQVAPGIHLYGIIPMRETFNKTYNLAYLSLKNAILNTSGLKALAKGDKFLNKKENSKLIAVSINHKCIDRIGYFTNENVYLCCKKAIEINVIK